MKKLSKIFLLPFCLLFAGCGPPASVRPVIDTVAQAKKMPDSTYQVQLHYSVTTSGGPCFNLHSFFSSTTSHYMDQLNVKSIEGVQDATHITAIFYVGEEFPEVRTNMQGTVSFTNDTMNVQLELPDYPDGVHTQGYVPYELNGTYQVVTDLSSNATTEPPTK